MKSSLCRFWLVLMAYCGLMVVSTDARSQQPAAGNDAVGGFLAFQQVLVAFSSRFEQITYEADGYVLERSEGQLFFQAPNRLRFAYGPPSNELIVGDGVMLWHYDPGLEQATVREQSQIADTPIRLLTDADYLRSSYQLLVGERPDVIEMVPLMPSEQMQQVHIRFDGEKPISIGWEDGFGQLTEIQLYDFSLNPQLGPSLFEFTSPPGTDVLEGM